MSYNNDAKNCQKNAPVLITVENRARLCTDLIKNFGLKSTNDLKKDADAFIDCINKHVQSNAVVPEEFYQLLRYLPGGKRRQDGAAAAGRGIRIAGRGRPWKAEIPGNALPGI